VVCLVLTSQTRKR